MSNGKQTAAHDSAGTDCTEFIRPEFVDRATVTRARLRLPPLRSQTVSSRRWRSAMSADPRFTFRQIGREPGAAFQHRSELWRARALSRVSRDLDHHRDLNGMSRATIMSNRFCWQQAPAVK